MSDDDRYTPAIDEMQPEQLEGSAAAIVEIVDRLEELVGMGKRVPFSGRVMVEAADFLELVDSLRVAVPNEIRMAQRVIKERERIIGEAQEEAARILKTARERAEYAVSEQGLLLEARQQSEELLRQTEERRQRSMGMVDVYALQQFEKAEDSMREVLRIIDSAFRDAIDSLEQARGAITDRHP